MTETIARLRWYLNRLRCMTPAEIVYRAARMLALRVQRLVSHLPAACPAPDLARVSRHWLHTRVAVDASGYLAAADRIVQGRLDVFALRGALLGSPPLWNRDPSTGVQAPLRFGPLLDYRDPRLVGDIKYLWELNRHLHLVTLAQAFALSGEHRYAGVLRQHLLDWFEACPYPMGPNWSSALEAALRLINWSAAWQLLGGASARVFDEAEGARLRARWLESVYRHATFVRRNFSLHSSANNHLVGEAAGLFIAALTWPYWRETARWQAQAAAILEREALLQNGADGVNREQAVSYQQFALELLLLPLLAGRANGVTFSPQFEARLEAMIEYLVSIMDAGGNVPMFGDSDDAQVLNLAQQPGFCRYRSLMATGALLFRRSDFKAKAGELDDKTRWLFGSGADGAYARLDSTRARLPPRRAFPEGGYFVLGCDFESSREIRLVADAGPLGYGRIAAHGHADALSFTLSVGGREFLVDPGTYAYHAHAPWRAYFRGTAAHNTVRLDALDQSRPGGNFMWLSKAKAGCSVWHTAAERDTFEGWHDGYRCLRDPVLHVRRIELDKGARRLFVDDVLRAGGAHDVELFFHCSERCRVEPADDGYALTNDGITLILHLPRVDGASVRVLRGSTEPICGWRSTRFDQKQPAPTLCWRARLAAPVHLRTTIDC